jgi:Tfp pilus assembly protein PilF
MIDERLLQAGLQAMQDGNLPVAEQVFSQLVAQEPRMHQAWNMLAIIATMSGMPDVGLQRSRQALSMDRRNPNYLNTLAVSLGELGQLDEAKAALQKALREKPTYAEAHYNLGKTLFKMEDLKAASVSYGRAHALKPDYPGLLFNWAYTKRMLKDYAGAKQLLQELLAREPNDADAMVQLCEVESQGLGDAVLQQYLEDFVHQHPDFSPIREKLGCHLLLMGQFSSGWSEYWYRMTLPQSVRDARHHAGIPYLPPSLSGQSVLVRAEQGLGDVLFFLRFAPQLRQRGARVVVEVQGKLLPLVRELPFVDEWLLQDAGASGALHSQQVPDHVVWAGDLALLLRDATTPAALPLKPDPVLLEQCRARLAKFGPGPYLGLTWRAGTDSSRAAEFDVRVNPNRSLRKVVPVGEFARAVSAWPGSFVSLQREPYPEEMAVMQSALPRPMLDLSDLNDDLPAMLAVLACLDDYAGVSNTNVHLRAGLGLGGRILLPAREFRWMSQGDESPWFPGWKIYRKQEQEGWAPPMEALTHDLRANSAAEFLNRPGHE